MKKDVYYENILNDLYGIIKKIDVDGFQYLTNLSKYNGKYEKCYETFIENFQENEENYEPYSQVINELLNRESKSVRELTIILDCKFDSTNDTYYTFILDMLDGIIFENTEGYCLEELEFLQKR